MPGEVSAQQLATKDYIGFAGFQTMDTQSARQALEPNKLAWCENLIIVAPNQLAAMNGPVTPPLTTITGEVIASQFTANYGGVDYIINFCQSGSAYQVNAVTGAQVLIAPASTFSLTPDMTVWQSQRILIADATAGYSTWDGTAFVKQGGVSPNLIVTAGGSGYTSGATVAITGGSGSGATATATVVAGVVTKLNLTAPGSGYKAADTLTLTITAVGAGTGATGTAIVWPFFAVTPTTLAVFVGRVWLGAARTLQWTGTKGFDDSNPANASGSTTIADADLVHSITALRSLNNFLYIFGDASIKQIGTVTVQSSSTIFNIVTLSSDQGTTFPRAIASYNRLILFANKVGVYAILGASVEKVSDPMDGIFALADFSTPLQAAIQDLHTALHTFLLLLRYKDPVKGTRSLILCFYKNRWFVANQGNMVATICSLTINGIVETFVSSGNDVTQIFQSTNPVPIILQTSLTAHSKPHMGKRATACAIAYFTNTFSTVLLTTDSENGSISFPFPSGNKMVWLNNSNQVVIWKNNLGQVVDWFTTGFVYQRSQAAATGVFLGVTITGSFAGTGAGGSGFVINQVVMEYQDAKVLASRPSA
jgi:hypothetical protein